MAPDRDPEFRRLAACAAIAWLTLAPPALAQAGQGSRPPDADVRRMLVTRVDVQRRGTGAIVVIVTPHGRRTIAYGSIAAGSVQPVAGDTVFGVASITKVFTALLLADMAQRGALTLDDPVARHLPRGAGPLPALNGRAITLADLATHTAGLPLRPDNLVSQDPDNKYDAYTPELLYAFLASVVLPREPGSAYEYSNVGYGLLGQVLSQRTGLSYEQLVRRITGPLAMPDTRMDLTPGMRRRHAVGYTTEGRAIRDAERGALDASGALHSTANDLARLLEGFLGIRATPLAPAMAAMLQTRRPGGMAPWSAEIALAWNVWKGRAGEVAWKNGSAGGFRSFIGFDRRARLGVVALINVQSDYGVDDIGMHLLGTDVVVDLHVPRIHTQVPIDPALFDRYAGRYRYSDTDILTVVRDGDRLFGQEPGQPTFELLPEGERDFFLREADAQVTFESDGDGPATAAVWHQAGQDQRGVRLP